MYMYMYVCYVHIHVHSVRRTSSQGQDVLDAEGLGLHEVHVDGCLGLVGTRDVQHGLQTAVVEGSTGNGHGAGLLVT